MATADLKVLVCDSCGAKRMYYMDQGSPVPFHGPNKQEHQRATLPDASWIATEVYGNRVVVSGAEWSKDEHSGKYIQILDAKEDHAYQSCLILKNTEDTLYVRPVIKGDLSRAKGADLFSMMPRVRLFSTRTLRSLPGNKEIALKDVKEKYWDKSILLCNVCGSENKV